MPANKLTEEDWDEESTVDVREPLKEEEWDEGLTVDIPEGDWYDEQKELRHQTKFSPSEAYLRALGQFISLENLDEWIAKGQAGYDVATGAAKPEEKQEIEDKYWKEQMRQDVESRKQHEGAALLGELTGVGLMSYLPVPGSRLGTAGKTAASMGKMAKYIDNLRKARGWEGVRKRAPIYGTLGTLQGAGASDKRIGSSIADLGALKTGFGQNKRGWKEAGEGTYDFLASERQQRRLGRELLTTPRPGQPKKPLLGWRDKPSDLAPKLTTVRKEIGAEIGQSRELVDTIHPKGAISIKSLHKGINELIAEIHPIGATAKNKIAELRKLKKDWSKLFPSGRVTVEQVEDIKRKNYKFEFINPADPLVGNKRAAAAIREKLEKTVVDAMDAVEKGAEGHLKNFRKDYQKSMRRYKNFKTLEKHTFDRATGDKSNRVISLTDHMGGIGMGLGIVGTGTYQYNSENEWVRQVVTTALAAWGFNQVRTRGNSFKSRLLFKLANKSSKTPGFASKFGGKIMKALYKGPSEMVIVDHLLRKKDPEYRYVMEQDEQEEEEQQR